MSGGGLFAVLALFSVSAGQVGPALHALTVEHARCAEHGELVEISNPSHGASPGSAGHGDLATDPSAGATDRAPPSRSPVDHLARSSEAADVHDHGHCSLLAGLPPDGLTPAEPPSACSALSVFLERAPSGRSDTVRAATYRLAPKQSPPSRLS